MEPATLQELIRKMGRRYILAKGQVVQSTENREVFNLIVSGYFKRYLISSEGSIRVQVVYGKGDIFPITLAFKLLFNQDVTKSPEVFYYETMTKVDIRTIDRSVLIDAVRSNSDLYKELMMVSGRRLSSTLSGLENLTLGSSYKRVAHKLAFFGRAFGKKTDKGICIDVPLTQQDIADILSLTRETVSASMNKLKKEGFIEIKRNILIKDIEALDNEAYS